MMFIYIVSTVVVGFLTLVHWLLSPPRAIRDVPSISIPMYLYYFIGGKSREEIHDLLIKPALKKHGRVVRIWRFGSWVVMTTDPKITKTMFQDAKTFPKIGGRGKGLTDRFVGKSFVFKNGHEWLKDRKVVNPAFHRTWETGVFGDVAENTSELIRKSPNNVDILDMMNRATLDAMGRVVFDYDFEALTNPSNKYRQAYNNITSAMASPIRFLFPVIDSFGFESTKKAYRDMDTFDELIYKLIKDRKEAALNRKKLGVRLADDDRGKADLLTLMTDAVYNSDAEGEDLEYNEENLRNNVILFYIAGHDTTSFSLTYAILELARNPDVQAKGRSEVIAALKSDGVANPYSVTPTYEQQKRFNLVDQIIRETQRKNPIFTMLSRKIAKPVQIDKYNFPPGTIISTYVYGLHNDESIYPNPGKFDPSRFDDQSQEAKNRPPCSWLAFGAGIRQCIGTNFSMTEQRVLLAMLLLRFEWTLPKDSAYWTQTLSKNGFFAIPKDLYIDFKPLGQG